MKDRIKTLATALKAFGDQKRLLIIKMLASNMDEIHCVSDVAKALGITQPAASQHIRILKQIGVLKENRKGFRVYYTVDTAVLQEYKALLDDLFKKAFEKCDRQYACAKCPYNAGCGGK